MPGKIDVGSSRMMLYSVRPLMVCAMQLLCCGISLGYFLSGSSRFGRTPRLWGTMREVRGASTDRIEKARSLDRRPQARSMIAFKKVSLDDRVASGPMSPSMIMTI
ncbi:hypothetical protein BDZ94DRAFT_1253508 [Collybia nuda]|uniref:Uncharacterized protein n=1 Tax=Collybia nuda TaxID=64659 RepID=A0A9P5YBD4_9AGAR|nr:hypothetical protein BDZ94DRAFT_1253508 [Collybia nuda]